VVPATGIGPSVGEDGDQMSEAVPVFNIVVTGRSFWHLRFFVCSLVHNSDARFRFVANGCAPETFGLMDEYATAHPGRILDVVDVSSAAIIAHGVALDRVRSAHDDGELFCFVDPDIKATGPFLSRFSQLLRNHSAVTSGKQVWIDDHVVPDTHRGIGLDGRHFFHPNGFVYGCPHFAMYRRADLDETCARWSIGLGSAGPELTDGAKARLTAEGHFYKVYDTGKVVNIFLQLDGNSVCHVDPDELIHIGGMSHFLSPPDPGAKSGEIETPSWARYHAMEPRLATTRYTAALLRNLAERRPLPPRPPGLEPELDRRLLFVRDEVIDLVERYRECSRPPVGARS
jgi:hypothetical protein